MATDKKVFTLRLQPETYEKARYLAYIERRSIAMEIEYIINKYAENYEQKNGKMPISVPSESK